LPLTDCKNPKKEQRRVKMEMFYYLVFGGLGAVVAALELSKTSKDRTNTSSAFNSFKNNYLLVYSLMMGMLPYYNLTQPPILNNTYKYNITLDLF
jgi:hypothetical protein